MDDIDASVLAFLASDGRSTLAALGERVGLSAPAVHERIDKLEASGAIRGYAALVDPEAVGSATAALVFMRLEGGRRELEGLERELAAAAEVLELHEVAGEDCYVAKVRLASPSELGAWLHRLREDHPTLSTRSSVVLRSCFERPLLWPVDQPPPLRTP